MSDNRACEVPLIELLRSVPKDQCMSLVTQWSSDGRETGHMHIPVGVLAHRAADELAAAQERMDAIGRIPAVRDRAGVGDGSLYDAVVALTGALEVARRDLSAAQDTRIREGIEVEKMLCDVLGRPWAASGFSIETLIRDIKAELAELKGRAR